MSTWEVSRPDERNAEGLSCKWYRPTDQSNNGQDKSCRFGFGRGEIGELRHKAVLILRGAWASIFSLEVNRSTFIPHNSRSLLKWFKILAFNSKFSYVEMCDFLERRHEEFYHYVHPDETFTWMAVRQKPHFAFLLLVCYKLLIVEFMGSNNFINILSVLKELNST